MTKDMDKRSGQATAAVIHELYKNEAPDWRRDHLGASVLGHKCARFLWLTFRWAAAAEHSGQTLRLFERGKREEQWLIGDLTTAGLVVRGTQERVQWGHVAGSVDGLIDGIVEAPKVVHVLEIKTSSAKQFAYLKEKRVKTAKREHWIQMQIYMLGLNLSHAFYLVVNKDNDEIYGERVAFDEEAAKEALSRAQGIVEMSAPPGRLDSEAPPCMLVSKDGTRYPCRFYDLCHGTGKPERNCRTCVHSTPELAKNGDPIWTCALELGDLNKGKRISGIKQRSGCAKQRSIPPIVNAQVSIESYVVTYYYNDGTRHAESDR